MKLPAVLIFAIFSRVVVGAVMAQGTHAASAAHPAAGPTPSPTSHPAAGPGPSPTSHPAAGPPPAPMRLDSSMVRFLSGDWVGQGSFANGAAISAKVSFRVTLDGAWLVCEHRDDPPGRYAATLYWGVDPGTGQFLAYAFDNFQGHRVFTGNASGNAGGKASGDAGGKAAGRASGDAGGKASGDAGGKAAGKASGDGGGREAGKTGGMHADWHLVLTGQAFAPGVGTYYEHFIYQRLSDTQFKMSYETSMDAISWRLGDSLVFTRKG